jgi:hypothetical protein
MMDRHDGAAYAVSCRASTFTHAAAADADAALALRAEFTWGVVLE